MKRAELFLERLPTHPDPWQTISSENKYSNSWISVREDQVLRPDGQPGIYGVVESRIATAVVAMDADQNVWLVGQYRYPTKQYSWEIIEGGADFGESALTAIKRELKEEAHVGAKNWLQLGDPLFLSNCFSAEVAYVFLARDLYESRPVHLDPTEQLHRLLVPFNEIVARVRSGEISDALSIIAIQRAKDFLA